MAQSDIKAEALVSDLNAGECNVSASGDVENTVLLDDKVEERSRHNAQQPLFRLSPEILATILGFLRDISPINMWSHQPTPEAVVLHRLGWAVTTHVCRRLRNVALDCSELWSTIQYTGIATSFTRECLQRSRNATINVIVSELWDDEPGAQFLNLFRSSHVVSRIQSLKIDTLLSSFLETILPYPWPQLESLEMDCNDMSDGRAVLTLPLRCADSKAPRFDKPVSHTTQLSLEL
ncbi:hypothetical protein BC629DRAFT_1452479 [Irpex lacteus]|nr:hypothetical protein BC629DRAFT_1452479 [Irpex lacteus]